MRQRAQWCGGETGFEKWRPRWGLERKILEVSAWRVELEVRLMGAMLNMPAIGVLRAAECGLTAAAFDCDDTRLMFEAVRCCREQGRLDDRTYVLATVIAALRWGGLYKPWVTAHDRGFYWSEESLVELACVQERDPDVRAYARQLVEIDAAVRRARVLWREMAELFDNVGRVTRLDGTCREFWDRQGRRDERSDGRETNQQANTRGACGAGGGGAGPRGRDARRRRAPLAEGRRP